jgi:hypothetical protein
MYLSWTVVSQQANGDFPYDFMNDMQQPSGMIKTATIFLLIVAGIFYTAKRTLTGHSGNLTQRNKLA